MLTLEENLEQAMTTYNSVLLGLKNKFASYDSLVKLLLKKISDVEDCSKYYNVMPNKLESFQFYVEPWTACVLNKLTYFSKDIEKIQSLRIDINDLISQLNYCYELIVFYFDFLPNDQKDSMLSKLQERLSFIVYPQYDLPEECIRAFIFLNGKKSRISFTDYEYFKNCGHLLNVDHNIQLLPFEFDFSYNNFIMELMLLLPENIFIILFYGSLVLTVQLFLILLSYFYNSN